MNWPSSGTAKKYFPVAVLINKSHLCKTLHPADQWLFNAAGKPLAAVALYVAHYNLYRSHEALKTAPAVALGITDHVWTVGDLLDAALATQPITSVTTAPDRRRRFRVIEGGAK
jgi:hypothetical protein